ncbi:MAG: DUF4062 domain-containing protein [Cyanobium sp. CZS 48M]|nr:DUF4062 domain-containing protein [Cyanobium sp. CZS48M]
MFLSHTSELRLYPSGGSYVSKAERAVSACGHVVVDMADFPSIDQAPAAVCTERVGGSKRQQGCDVYVGIFGTRYSSPVRDRPEVSYTELEFDTATEAPIPRLVFLLDTEAADLGIPSKALIDRTYGDRQEAFLEKVGNAGLTLQKFSNPDQLSQLLERSLKALAGGTGPDNRKTYTPADLNTWVEQHHQALERAFCAIPSVQQRRLPVLIETALGEKESVADRVRAWLQAQLPGASEDLDPALVEALLAQMFIDDVIAKRRQGLLAGSVPELMLSYVVRVDTPSDPGMRQRAGLRIDGPMVQRALRVLALASHRQGQNGRPLFQPVEFPGWLAEQALGAADGMDLEGRNQRQALLGYLIDLNLLRTPGADESWLRFPLDPLADYLAALRQLERLEADSAGDGALWQEFLAELEQPAHG